MSLARSLRGTFVARRVFYSFHYDLDNWRVQTVRNINSIEPQPKLSSNDWETVWRQGDRAVEAWIARQMQGKSCVVVLIGSQTASRRWVRHEIIKGWNDKRGVVGIHIHNLKDSSGRQASKGVNPFDSITLDDGSPLSGRVQCYDPPYSDSASVYAHIAGNIEAWTEAASSARGR
ncbi:TIR domain-containing protein [Actinomycetes bacterium KLBMP 9759]